MNQQSWLGIRPVLSLFAAISIGLVAAPASAVIMKVEATPSEGQYQEWILDSNSGYGTYTPNSDGTLNWSGTYSVENKLKVEWDVHLDPDPGISGPVVVTNNFGVTATFNLFMLLPVIGSYPAGTLMSGSSSITINDSSQNGAAAMAALNGSAVYNALVDGNIQRQLFTDVYSLSPTFGPPGSTASETRNFSGELTTFALNSEIGIQHRFSLTPLDSATANSSFLVVPEPSACWLALAGIALVAGVKFRRRAG